ncbi:MAG: ABC transporter transmembrane domain-containing protein [Pseudomonadota bacterium]
MDTRFFSFVWRHSKREQLFILAITLVSFPLVYASLEIPKIIVNQAIDGTDFPQTILGFEFQQVPYLLILCFIFLALVIIINGIKWVMNIAIGMTGERMLRRLRFMLFEHVMRFRMSRFKTTKPGEVIQSMLGEIEPLGGFIGEVIATPAFQGGLLVVYSIFIFMQDWLLGLAAVAFYPIQAWLIPKLQAKVIRLNKERASNTRALADTISESVGNIAEIHTNDTARWHLGQIAGRLHQNTVIRLALFKRKFTIKFINNLINQLTPFFFYSIGGYLVIKGQLDFGALVAVLAAYKDIAGPWKAVLNFVQRWTDFNSRYVFVVENFIGDGVMDAERIYLTDTEPLQGDLKLMNIEGGPGAGGLTVPALEIAHGEIVAVTGGASGAREALLGMIAGLAEPASGRVTIGGKQVSEARLAELGATISHVQSDPGLISRSLRENMLYGLYRAAPMLEESARDIAREFLKEARATGNITADPDGDWVDYTAADVMGAEALEERLLHLVARFDLGQDMFAAALSSRIAAGEADAWTGPVLKARHAMALDGRDVSDLVEAWSPEAFNTNATLLENVLYALPTAPVGDFADYVDHPGVSEILERSGALAMFESIGWDIACEFAELVGAVESDSIVLDSFAAYSKSELQTSAELLEELGPKGIGSVNLEQRRFLISLALKYVPTRDRLDVLDDQRSARFQAYREAARGALDGRNDFVSFDKDQFNPAQTIAENLLHGRRRFDRKSAWKTLDAQIEQAVDAAGLRQQLIRLGLDRPVGNGGAGMSASLKRRIALVRAVISRPRILVLDGVAAGDGPTDISLRKAIREELPGATLIYAANTEKAAEDASRVIEIEENGTLR